MERYQFRQKANLRHVIESSLGLCRRLTFESAEFVPSTSVIFTLGYPKVLSRHLFVLNLTSFDKFDQGCYETHSSGSPISPPNCNMVYKGLVDYCGSKGTRARVFQLEGGCMKNLAKGEYLQRLNNGLQKEDSR